ncbi:metal-dependent hydrolase [Paenibacillus sp. TRM 82003]|nr:metal-dependent hydrolase [Paenibacillus sp. TRM 82003]
MDTGTHFAFGFGLAGLSQIDPNVAGDPWTSLAVLIATVAGSQAPDADTLLKFRGNVTYVRNHRGLSHSIPAWFFWTGLISSALWLVFPNAPFATLALWTFIAVFLHVASDMFNTYGTQAMRPITSRWIAWNVIHIFDPFLFGAHVIAIVLWLAGFADPTVAFPTLYAVLLGYYVWRAVVHAKLEKTLPAKDPEYAAGDRYTAIPTVNWNVWNIVRRRGDVEYAIGVWKDGTGLKWNESFACESSPEIEASQDHPVVAAFLSFSPYPCARMERRGSDTIVIWVDARYQHRKQFPFLAVVKYNKDMVPVFSYVGWISEEKLERKLQSALSEATLVGSR